MRAPRVGPALRRAVEADLAAALAQAEQRLEQFGAPRADEAGEAEDFARPHREARVLGEARRAEVARLRSAGAPAGAGGRGG